MVRFPGKRGQGEGGTRRRGEESGGEGGTGRVDWLLSNLFLERRGDGKRKSAGWVGL